MSEGGKPPHLEKKRGGSIEGKKRGGGGSAEDPPLFLGLSDVCLRCTLSLKRNARWKVAFLSRRSVDR